MVKKKYSILLGDPNRSFITRCSLVSFTGHSFEDGRGYHIYQPSARAGYDTRSIFKRTLAGEDGRGYTQRIPNPSNRAFTFFRILVDKILSWNKLNLQYKKKMHHTSLVSWLGFMAYQLLQVIQCQTRFKQILYIYDLFTLVLLCFMAYQPL